MQPGVGQTSPSLSATTSACALIAATNGQWFKVKYTARYIGYLVMFGLMGIWHGPTLQRILCGLYHALLFTSRDVFQGWNKVHGLWSKAQLSVVAEIIPKFSLVAFGFLILSGRVARKTARSKLGQRHVSFSFRHTAPFCLLNNTPDCAIAVKATIVE